VRWARPFQLSGLWTRFVADAATLALSRPLAAQGGSIYRARVSIFVAKRIHTYKGGGALLRRRVSEIQEIPSF